MRIIEFFRNVRRYFKMRDQEMNLRSMAIGMNSSTDITKDEHILMLDYDVHDISLVEESVRELQEFWMLSDAQIYRTRNGHHVFFWFDQMPYERLKMIINYARYVDPMYKFISRYYDHKTIRASGKYAQKDIHYIKTIQGMRDPTQYEQEIGTLKRSEHKMLVER